MSESEHGLEYRPEAGGMQTRRLKDSLLNVYLRRERGISNDRNRIGTA